MAKILLVEDDNNLREIYEARLQAEGYTIVSAKDGEEALVVAKAEKPDLVISDVMMPKISGFEMLDILRNTNELKGVKVIMLTALGQSDDQQRADKLGADRYLVKSQVTLEDIVKVTHELLDADGAAAPPAADTAAAKPAEAPAPESEPAADVPAAEPAPAPEPAAPEADAPKPEEPAAESGAQPAPDSTASDDAAKPAAEEEAEVDAKIEDFVAGATTEATPPAAAEAAPAAEPAAAPETPAETPVETPAAEPAETPAAETPETKPEAEVTPAEPAPAPAADDAAKAETAASDDKLMADAVEKLVASAGEKDSEEAPAKPAGDEAPSAPAASTTVIPVSVTDDQAAGAATAEPEEEKKEPDATSDGTVNHKKIIQPLDDGEPKKDINQLLAEEQGQTTATTPGATVMADVPDAPKTDAEDRPAGSPPGAAAVPDEKTIDPGSIAL